MRLSRAPRRRPRIGFVFLLDPALFVVNHNMSMTNTTSNWLCFCSFLSSTVPSLRIHWPLTTGYCSRATGHYPLATRPTPPSAGTSGVRSCANPPPLASLSPTVGLPKTERDPISTGPPILLCHRTKRFLRTNQTILPLPARRRPTVDHSFVAGSAQRHQFQACLVG